MTNADRYFLVSVLAANGDPIVKVIGRNDYEVAVPEIGSVSIFKDDDTYFLLLVASGRLALTEDDRRLLDKTLIKTSETTKKRLEVIFREYNDDLKVSRDGDCEATDGDIEECLRLIEERKFGG